MKTILLIETIEQDRILVDEIIKKRKNYSLIHAHDGKTALDVLASAHPDLLIVNLDIPQATYLRLIIKYISKEYFNCQVITIASNYNLDTRTRLDKLGVFKHLQKPLDPKTLLDNIDAELHLRPKSKIAGIATSTFFQLIKLDRKTCTLRIIHENKIGVLYCHNGNIIDAVTANLSGTEAAIEIARWEPITIIMQDFCRKQQPSISAPMEFILLESARKNDELNSIPEASDTVLEEEDLDKFSFDTGTYKESAIPIPEKEPPAFKSYTDIEYFWMELEHIIKADSNDAVLEQLADIETICPEHVSGCTVLAHDGKILSRKNFNGNYGKFVTQTAIDLIDLKENFDFDNPIFYQLSLLGNKKLLVLIGRLVTIGLLVND